MTYHNTILSLLAACLEWTTIQYRIAFTRPNVGSLIINYVTEKKINERSVLLGNGSFFSQVHPLKRPQSQFNKVFENQISGLDFHLERWVRQKWLNGLFVKLKNRELTEIVSYRMRDRQRVWRLSKTNEEAIFIEKRGTVDPFIIKKATWKRST